MADELLTIGAPVIFMYGATPVPATVVDPLPREVDGVPEALGLHVLTMTDGAFTTYAPYHPAGAPATWHWPSDGTPAA